MRRASLVLFVLLSACPKRDEAKPAPETKASTAPEVDYPLEALTCRDGVLGSTVAAAASAPVPSIAPSVSASSEAPPPSLSALIADAGSLFAPIGDGGFGVGGLGMSGIGGVGFGTGTGYGRAGHIVFPVLAEPLGARGRLARAVATGACAAMSSIKRCHADARNPPGHMVFDVTMSGDRAQSAKQTAGDLTDATLTTCVSAALVAANYEAAGNGTTSYKITFEPMKKVPAPSLRETGTTVSGKLPPEVIRRIVRSRMAQIRYCYEKALQVDPKLAGNLKVKFTIDPKGATKDVSIADGTITDAAVRSCVTGAFSKMSFPEPDGGVVQVTYPIEFAPG